MTSSITPHQSPSNEELASEMCTSLPPSRTLFSYAMTGLAFLLTGLAIVPLFSILLEILIRGLPNLSFDAFFALPAPVGSDNAVNGFANAILGTLMMVVTASVISIPLGVITAIYLSEFSQGSATANFVRFLVQVLSGVPSIVVGVFAYAVIVLSMKSFSGLAGSFALALVMLPIIVLTTEEALKLVPRALRLGSAGLGASRFQTTFRVVVATAIPGITTGVLLAVARASGETAPLLFTALFSLTWPQGLTSPSPSLSVLIYNYATSPFVEQNKLAWTASVVLVGLVLLTSFLSRVATQKRIQLR